jgi:hypothetical protein
MTQYQQVLQAIRSLGGRGTTDDIFKAIVGINNWGAKNPKATVASILSRGMEYKKEGDVWVYNVIPKNNFTKGKAAKQKNFVSTSKPNSPQNWLYLITLSYVARPIVPGIFLIKVGKATGNLASRIKGYSASLPFETIQLLESYKVPFGVDLIKVETLVRQKLENFKSPDFSFKRYITGHQREWQQVSGLHFSNDNIVKVTTVVNQIVMNTINNLKNATRGQADEN